MRAGRGRVSMAAAATEGGRVDDEERLASGAAWDEWCERLRALGQRILADDFPGTPRDRAEGYRHLARQVVFALQWHLERADPAAPAFYRFDDDLTQWGAPNADNHYLRTAVDPAGVYRVTGDVAGVAEVIVSAHEGDMALGRSAVYAERRLADLGVGPDGALDLVVGGDDPGDGRPWLPLDPGARLLLVRQYVFDWEHDPIADLRVERVDGDVAPPPPADPARVAAALDRAGEWITTSVEFWNDYSARLRHPAFENLLTRPHPAPGGAADIAYGGGAWDLGPDRCLVIACEPPDADAWSFQAYRLGWYEALDVAHRVTSLNHRQVHVDGDGRFRIVVAARRPRRAELARHRGPARGRARLPLDRQPHLPGPRRHRRRLRPPAGPPAGRPPDLDARRPTTPARRPCPRHRPALPPLSPPQRDPMPWTPPPRPRWLAQLDTLADGAGGADLLVDLGTESLLAAGRAAADRAGVHGDDDAAWGGTSWREGFAVLVAGLRDEARLHAAGRILARAEIVRALRNRRLLAAARAADPTIETEPIEAPVFVVGTPRSGTSITHQLLALDPAHRVPETWEVWHPIPLTPGADDAGHRVALAEAEVAWWRELVPEYDAMHHNGAHLPAECIFLTAPEFRSDHWAGTHHVPGYSRWLAHGDPAPAYRYHRGFLQVLQHRQRAETWVLKAPSHLFTLDALFREYPDAHVVQLHRDPVRVVASNVSLMATLRWMRSEHVDVAALARTTPAGFRFGLEQAMRWRDDGTVPDERVVDVRYHDLLVDPAAALAGVYERLGRRWTTQHERRVVEYLAATPQGTHGRHEYTLADVGLDRDRLRRSFAGYRAHYGIPEEP